MPSRLRPFSMAYPVAVMTDSRVRDVICLAREGFSLFRLTIWTWVVLLRRMMNCICFWSRMVWTKPWRVMVWLMCFFSSEICRVFMVCFLW
jgi:hypothetical protein